MKPSRETDILGNKEIDTLEVLESIESDETVIQAILGKLLNPHAVIAPSSDRMKLLLVKAQVRHAENTRSRFAHTLQ